VCGLFDWSLSPSASNWPTLLIMKIGNVRLFGEAYLGIRTMEERRDPAICTIYFPVFRYPGSQISSLETLKAEGARERVKLPPALFLCSTLDPVIDDTVMGMNALLDFLKERL